ncbi:MAG TPA: ATP-binding protein [Candidatus Bathyarchaeia archaeon]|nr:ATP-binding protein [Candidatus Bathyarchaeia archaeon]
MIVYFVNREHELETLGSLLSRGKPALVLLYGRRRVGKTRLIQEFLKDKKGMYFYVPNAEAKTILDEFSRTVEGEFFKGFRFADYDSFLDYVAKKSEQNVIVAIDEFQRLANRNGAISLLQKYWDQRMSKTKSFIILSGSTIGAIRKVALRGDAPLYGRRTATLKVEPLKFLDLPKWFRKYGMADLVKVYASFGGTPAYLEQVDEKNTVEDNILSKILNKHSPLYGEPEMLLMEEIRAPHRYMDILAAIAQGKNKISEIADATGLARENTTTYLKTLETLDLIERMTSVTEPQAKKGMYKIKDPFFTFWFRFVKPNRRQLELELEHNLWSSIQEEFNTYLGRAFEDVCLQILAQMAKRRLLPIQPDRIGKWWWMDAEIDILAIETKQRRTLAIETKWTELNYSETKSLLGQLNAKTAQIPNTRETCVGVIAKKIANKERLRSQGFTVLDLQDIENLAKTQTGT